MSCRTGLVKKKKFDGKMKRKKQKEIAREEEKSIENGNKM